MSELSFDNGNIIFNNGVAKTIVQSTATADVTVNLPDGSGTLAYLDSNITGNAVNVTGIVQPANGGTGVTSAPTSGQILIGNAGGTYTAASISTGTGISSAAGSGSITLSNTGVTSVAGTTNQLTVSGATGAVTLSLPSNVSIGGINLSGLTASSFVYVDASKNIASAAATDGQLMIGRTGNTPVLASIGTGSGISVAGGAGSITISNTGVLSISGGVTGLTPNIGTTGNVTLSGVLNVANGGTGFINYTTGDILYANSATTLAKLSDIAAGNVLISNGIGLAPSYGKVGLSTHISGVLPVANGGTNSSTALTNGKLMASSGGAIVEGTDAGNPSFQKINLTTTATQITLGTGATVTLSASTPAASRVYTLPDVGTSSSFVMTDGAQTINGVKSFTSALVERSDVGMVLNNAGNTFGTTLKSASGLGANLTFRMPANLGTAGQVMSTDGAGNLSFITAGGGGGGSGFEYYQYLATTNLVQNPATNTYVTVFPSGTGSLTIPAGTLNAVKSIRFEAYGILSTNSGSQNNILIRVLFGPTANITIAESVGVRPFGNSGVSMRIIGSLMVRTTGASGTIVGAAAVEFSDGGNSGGRNQTRTITGSSVNTTVDNTLDVQLQFTSGSNNFTTIMASVWLA